MKRYRAPIFPAILTCVSGVLFLLTILLAVQPNYLAFATSGTVLHLPLDEAAGATTFADTSGYNHPATCADATCPVAGVSGHLSLAAQFTGTQYLTVTNAPTPTIFSLSLWFQWDDVNTANVQFLTGKGEANMELQTGGTTNNLRFIPAGFPATYVDAPNAILPGWNHVAATYDGSTTNLYVNGVLEASRTGITGGNDLSADATPLNLGRRSTGVYYFNGALDDVRVYDRVLSPAEIALLAEKPLVLVKAVAPVSNVPYHGMVTYTVTLMNADAISQTNVLVTDTLPTQVAFAGWVDTPPANTLRVGQQITWTGDIQAGQILTWTWTATHTGDYGETVNNTAYVRSVAQNSQAAAAFSVECGLAITVQNTNDSGAGSLRQALSDVCPGSVIDFAPVLAGQTITLTAQLNIIKSLTLDAGSLSAPVSLNGNHAVRILSISNGARVTLNRLQFVAGAVSGYDSGGGLYLESGTVTLTHSTVLSCTAGMGGGIANVWGALTVQDSTFSDNSASDRGGGLANVAGALTVQNSTFAGNSANSGGGGIFSVLGPLTVQDSTFYGNTTGNSGGGIYSEESTLTVQDSTFYGNSAWGGGGLHSYHDTRTVQNNTFVANWAYRGGGLYSSMGTLTMQNCTVAGNRADNYGGGVYGEYTLHNTILWGNTAPNDAQMSTSVGTIYSSVIQGGCPPNATCTNVITADPRLGALDDYGGSTLTVPLLPGSPAIDATSNACPAQDQRGETRSSPACDMGAFESRGFILSVLGGDRQTTRIKTVFPNALVVSVISRNAVEPVENGVVTFNAPPSGASASPGSNTVTIMGNVAAQSLIANGLTGAYTVTVSASGILTPATFVLTNTTKYAATVALASTPNPSGYGQTIILTATVSVPDPGGDSGVPTGSVAFTADGGTILGCEAQALDSNGQAVCTTAALVGGAHSLRAEYGGDGNYSSNISPAYVQVVTSVNHAPVAVSDVYTTTQDTALNVLPPGVLANDSDPDGDLLTAALVTSSMHGMAGLNNNGALLYLPTAGFVGPDTLTYLVSDGVLTATAQVTINVTAVNHPVIAHDDIAVTREDEPISVSAPGVLANDADPDGDPLTAEALTAPFTGTLTLSANGAYTYTPPLNFNDVVSFTYRVRDTGNLSATATVYILVQAVNDAPTFIKGADQIIRQGAGVQIVPGWATAISAGPANESWQTLAFQVTTAQPALFAVQPTADVSGTLRYAPAANASGVATMTVMLQDSGGTANGGVDTSTPQSFVITIQPEYRVYLPMAIKTQ